PASGRPPAWTWWKEIAPRIHAIRCAWLNPSATEGERSTHPPCALRIRFRWTRREMIRRVRERCWPWRATTHAWVMAGRRTQRPNPATPVATKTHVLSRAPGHVAGLSELSPGRLDCKAVSAIITHYETFGFLLVATGVFAVCCAHRRQSSGEGVP